MDQYRRSEKRDAADRAGIAHKQVSSGNAPKPNRDRRIRRANNPVAISPVGINATDDTRMRPTASACVLAETMATSYLRLAATEKTARKVKYSPNAPRSTGLYNLAIAGLLRIVKR
jgi:hypothetical protein